MSVAQIIGVDGVRPVVELGVGDTRIPVGQGRWDVAEWDVDPEATWAGTEPTWLDITCYVHDIEVETGRDRSMQTWAVGAATITVDNGDGWADMGQGPPTDPLSTLSIRPGRQLRAGISIDDGPVRWLYRGFIDDAEPRYEAEESDIVTLGCVDAKGEAGKIDVARVDPPVGVAETVTARIGRVLDLVLWPVERREIAATSVTLIGTELGARAVDLFDVAADSGGGVVFGDSRGYVVFRQRDWQTYAPTIPPEATIGNVDVDDVCPSGWERTWRREDVATRMIVGRSGEPGRTFDDEPNQIIYGIETISRTDLEADQDSQLDRLGERWLRVMSADYMPRVAAVTIDAGTSTAARDLAATVDPTVAPRYRCRHRRADGTVVFDAEFFATGVRHSISPTGWTCRITLDDAAPFAAAGGRWDAAEWDRTTWAEAI